MTTIAGTRCLSVLLAAMTFLGCVHQPQPVNSNLFLDDPPEPMLMQELVDGSAWIESIRVAKLNDSRSLIRESGSCDATIWTGKKSADGTKRCLGLPEELS